MTFYLKKFTTFEALCYSGAVLSLFLGFTSIGFFEIGKWVVLAVVVVVLGKYRRVIGIGLPYLRGLAVVVVVCAFSVVYSPEAWHTAQLIVALALVFAVVILVLGDPVSNRDRRPIDWYRIPMTIDRLAWANVLVALWLFLPGVVFLALGIDHPPLLSKPLFTGREFGWNIRYSGILGNPNQVGICAAVLTPLVLAKALENPAKRMLCWFVLVIVAYSVWISGSRNGLLSAGTGAALVVVLAGYGNRLLRGSAIVVAVIIVVSLNLPILFEYFTRSEELVVSLDQVGENRFERWEVGLQSIAKRPILGQGFGVGGVPKSGYVHPHEVDTGYPLHNSYLQITQEIGVVGLAPVMCLLIYGIILSFRSNRWVRANKSLRLNYAGFAGVVVAGALSTMFESWLIAPGNLGTLPFWCAIGVLSLVSVGSRSARAAMVSKRGRTFRRRHVVPVEQGVV